MSDESITARIERLVAEEHKLRQREEGDRKDEEQLESDQERHRLVSLLPPIHVAFIDGANICAALGEALAAVARKGPAGMSRAITFITGPSRTADIELTLTIGVHGPKELFVIVNEGSPLTNQ